MSSPIKSTICTTCYVQVRVVNTERGNVKLNLDGTAHGCSTPTPEREG